MNWFILLGGLLWLCGALQYWYKGNWRMSIVAICYAVAQFALVEAK